MSYFHTGIRTIIGAESFHCPVRDGKEWDQLAMVIRLKRFLACIFDRMQTSQFEESIYQGILIACTENRPSVCLGFIGITIQFWMIAWLLILNRLADTSKL